MVVRLVRVPEEQTVVEEELYVVALPLVSVATMVMAVAVAPVWQG